MDKAGPELSVGTFGPDHALSRKDIAAIYEEAKGILERIGVTCHSEKVMARIRKHEGVKVSADKGKIFLTGRLVDRFVKATRQANLKLAKSENRERKFKLYGPYVCLNYLDFETGIIRPANTADLIASLRLLESLGIPGDTAPVVLADVPRTVQNLSMFKTCLEHSEHIGGRVMSVASKEEADWIIKLGKASGRKPPYIDFEVSISPLTLDDKPFEIYLDYLDQGKAEYISLFPGTIPLAGVTAPLPFPGMLVQSIAESFAGYIIRDLVHALPGKITYESRLDIGPGMLFDMKTGTHLVQLMPESFSLDHIFTLFRSEILGCSCPQAFPLWSMSKSCDVYYGFSLGLSVLWAALKGTREFSWVGQLGGD